MKTEYLPEKIQHKSPDYGWHNEDMLFQEHQI
jgi:hypothetical protein